MWLNLCGKRVGQKPGHWRPCIAAGSSQLALACPAGCGTCGIHSLAPMFRNRKRHSSETLSEEERSSGDEHARMAQRRGRRHPRKEGRRRGEEVDRSHNYPKMLGRTGSPIMTECTAAMVSCCHLIDCSQSLFYFVPQEYHSQAGSTSHFTQVEA